MAFDNLGTSLIGYLNDQVGIGDNNISNPTNPYDYSRLGPFQKNIDKTAERRYVQQGQTRLKPQNLEILWQEPDVALLIKKKQFSSLAENYRYDLMNSEEKNYIKACKILFANKCKLINAFEKLSKIERIVVNNSSLNDFVLSQIFASVDTLNSLSPGLISGTTQSTLQTLKQIKNFSDANSRTTWVSNNDIPFTTDVGDGTGVIELTTLASFSSTTSVSFGAGNCELTLEDPYQLLIVREEDIEQAISDAVGFTNNLFFSGTKDLLNQTIQDLTTQLNDTRRVRGAARIVFKQNENSLLFKKLRAIIDEEGREIIFSFDGGVLGFNAAVELDASAFVGLNGLQNDEVDLFQQIITDTYQLMGLTQSTQNQIKQFNEANTYLRNRMMLEFCSKAIIQPTDSVHLFVSSKSQSDVKISQGFNTTFSKDNLLNKINTATDQLNSTLDNITNGFSGGSGQGSYIENEKNAMAGPDFPLWLWTLLRNDLTHQKSGIQIFGGIVDRVNRTLNTGFYNVTVTVKDNCAFLGMGKINIKPSVATVDSSLYDPLTPFNAQFDPSSGLLRGENPPPLLDENISLLQSGMLRANTGRNRGTALDQSNYFLKDFEILTPENPNDAKFRLKLNDPYGFVYRWKQGIGSLVLSGAPHNFGTGSLRNETAPVITNDPFAGQDVMNVISLLITGQPYNFNTFMKSAMSSGILNKDDLFNSSWSESYLKGLLSDLSKNNAVWGNFIPFKKVIINNEAYNFLKSGEFDVTSSTKKISDLLQQRAERFDQLVSYFPALASNPQFYKPDASSIIVDSSTISGKDTQSISTLASDIIDLDLQVKSLQDNLQNSLDDANLRTADGSLTIIGDDVSFDPTLVDTSSISPGEQERAQEELRKKLFMLSQRLFWKVKANQDTNYFIVDDSYDKNYDIQAFEAKLGSLSTFQSTYTTVGEKIQIAAKLLGLEVFADTQGHINARPPAYNRIPSSVFNKMIENKNTKGIQLFPDYLKSLFFHQIQGTTDRISILEDQIRLRATALGYVADSDVEILLSGSQFKGLTPSATGFKFLTDESTGELGGEDLHNLLKQASPDFMSEINQNALTDLSATLAFPANASINFDIIKRISLANHTFSGFNKNTQIRFKTLYDRLFNKNANPPTQPDLLPHDVSGTTSSGGISQVDALGIIDQISSFLSERQYVIKILSNSISNLQQGLQVNSDSNVSQGTLFSSLSGVNEFPKILQHMIEDESIDDLGYNSGKRYVIKDVDIISLNITEEPPPYTQVEVNGALANNLVQGPSGLEIGDNGNFIASAFAVDYDMWRLYGFKQSESIWAPFFSDPEAQCAPYAVFLLNQARKNIFKASLTIRGNEFIQPGEVYYIESEDLLFYCESVSHQFSYGSTFTTSLTLTYGHKPGQFIPTPLDIIGKGLYSNKNQADLVRHLRNEDPSGDLPITVIVNDDTNVAISSDATPTTNALDFLMSNSYGAQNQKNLTTLSLTGSGILTPTRYGDKIKLEIRVYFNSKNGTVDNKLIAFGNAIKDWLINPSSFSTDESDKTLPVNIDTKLTSNDIDVISVDLSNAPEVQESRSPSSQAWSVARSLDNNSMDPNFEGDSEQVDVNKLSHAESDNLFSKVIDIWAVFSDPEVTTLDNVELSGDVLNQDQLLLKQKYINAFNKKLGIDTSNGDLS
jgi:hypothetical protein